MFHSAAPGGDTCLSTGHVVNKCASTSHLTAPFYSSITVSLIGMYRISAPVNPKSGHYSEIRPSLDPAKFLAGFAGFGGYQNSCSTVS